MLDPSELNGLMAMMPAFATDDAADVSAVSTIAVDRLEFGLNRMIGDGVDVIATTGSFGEFHTLLPEEFATLAGTAAEVNNRRVPLFIGATGLNTREVIAKMRVVERTSAQGVLVGVPFYFPSSDGNVVQFFQTIAELFPTLSIMLYHNPPLHNVRLTIPIMEELAKIPNIIAMKDSHRNPGEFLRMAEATRNKVRVFVNQLQYSTFRQLGAAGFWSIEAWMGPWPQFALREAVKRNDVALANAITLDLTAPGGAEKDPAWRETAAKIAVRYAGYVDPGPLRPPFVQIPAEVDAAQLRRAEHWRKLCDKYRPSVSSGGLQEPALERVDG